MNKTLLFLLMAFFAAFAVSCFDSDEDDGGWPKCDSSNEGDLIKDALDYYVCRNGQWWPASSQDKDKLYQWNCSAENNGEIKTGDMTGNEYICYNNRWKLATDFEKDTWQWPCSNENYGEMKIGDFSGKEYICKEPGSWQMPSGKECLEWASSSGMKEIVYGEPLEYGGETYNTLVIGGQTWLARNLNYYVEGSECYRRCDFHGRDYDLNSALAVCPEGWHLPSNEEWDILAMLADDSFFAENDSILQMPAYIWWTSIGSDKFGTIILAERKKCGVYNFSQNYFEVEEGYSANVRCLKD
jgi:uncharacterized protein (TIGR02145 family)